MSRVPILASICLLAIAPLGFAHEVRPAFLQIQELIDADGARTFEVLWKQPAVQNGRLAIDPVFPAACVLHDLAPPQVTASALIQRWRTDCALDQGTIHISGLSATLTDVMVRFDRANGERENHVLRPENPTLDLSRRETSSLSYLVIGIEHLLFGVDHVLFIIGLILFIRVPMMLLKTVTAFTVAHSITLALSILGWVRLDQGPVEAVIALSILFLARELVQDESQRSRLTLARPWAMAFIFGLLHGLGFAGALSDVGLPTDALWVSLLLFNVGIELGQLLIIGLFLAASWLFAHASKLPDLTRITALGMGCLAAYWTIDRTVLLL